MLEKTLPSVLVIACGALAREIIDVTRINGWDNITLECLPANLHNRPERIPDAVAARLEVAADRFDHVLVGYADCGTGGRLDAVLDRYAATRMPGAHCYEFYATSEVFAQLHEGELGTFYLTDYLAKHFERLIWEGLGLAKHPELRDAYFGNYTRLLYLSQRTTPELLAQAEAAANTLGLRFEHRHVGYGDLATTLRDFVAAVGEQPLELMSRG